MNRPVVTVVTVVLGAVLLAASPASADRATAERYFRAGAKAYAAQNFGAAAQNFDEAYKAEALPEIAFSAAQAYRRLFRVDGQPAYVRRAVELYRIYLAAVKTGGRVGDAADNLAEMQRELDKLGAAGTAAAPVVAHTRLGVSVVFADQLVPDTGTLREIGDATGDGAARDLAATIDGKPVEPFALVDVAPTEHRIAVSAPGYFPIEKATHAVEGQASLVEVTLTPKPARVAITTEADARIAVDGRGVATAPTAPLELAAGTHLVTIARRGREPFGRELVVARGEQVTLAAPLAKTTRRKAVPWILGGAGLLAAGAITTGILAKVHDGRASDLRDVLDQGNRPPADADAYDREVAARDRDVTATWVLGGAAITAGTVGALLFLFDTPTPEGLRLTPAAGGAQVTYGHRF